MKIFLYLYLFFKMFMFRILHKSFMREQERYLSGRYCDRKGCRGKRVDHIHAGHNGVTYFCEKHRKWAYKLVENESKKEFFIKYDPVAIRKCLEKQRDKILKEGVAG